MPENMFKTAVVTLAALPTSTLSLVVELIAKLSDPEWVTALDRLLHNESLQPKDEESFDSSDATCPTRSWREENGVIRGLSVTSDGTTGEEWVEFFGDNLTRSAKDVLLSKRFVSTTGVTYEIKVLKGMLFKNNERFTSNIRAKAEGRGLTNLHVEAACLMRKKYSNEELKEMGLYWIVIMHEPIEDSDGDPLLLHMDRDDDDSWLCATYDRPGSGWFRDVGFAFAVSQVST